MQINPTEKVVSHSLPMIFASLWQAAANALLRPAAKRKSKDKGEEKSKKAKSKKAKTGDA